MCDNTMLADWYYTNFTSIRFPSRKTAAKMAVFYANTITGFDVAKPEGAMSVVWGCADELLTSTLLGLTGGRCIRHAIAPLALDKVGIDITALNHGQDYLLGWQVKCGRQTAPAVNRGIPTAGIRMDANIIGIKPFLKQQQLGQLQKPRDFMEHWLADSAHYQSLVTSLNRQAQSALTRGATIWEFYPGTEQYLQNFLYA